MKVRFGTNQYGDPVVWDTENTINGHMVLAGASGTGKTFRIRRLVNALSRAEDGKLRFVVLDPHGDMSIEGESVVELSEASPAGLNPMRISDDPRHGGPRKRIRQFLAMLKRTSHSIGVRQEATFVHLLSDLYAGYGFYPDDATTWSLSHDPRKNPRVAKRHPTLADLDRLTQRKLKALVLGADGDALSALDKLASKVRAMHRGIKADAKGDEVDFGKLRADAMEAYAKSLDALCNGTGRELDDYLRFSNVTVLQSIADRLTGLVSTGLFKDAPPAFDPAAAVWRLDMGALNGDEQQIAVDTIAWDIFEEARAAGQRLGVSTVLVIDEAHRFISEDGDQILNRIAKEGRKFGLALMLASQHLGHFSEDTLGNAGCKMVLGLDEMHHDSSARKLRIEVKRLKEIRPRKTALVQIKGVTAGENPFVDVVLEGGRPAQVA